MDQQIIARVLLDIKNPFEDVMVIVRKVVFRGDGIVDKKYGLSKTGNWIEVPEAAMYPDECYLPVAITKRSKK